MARIIRIVLGGLVLAALIVGIIWPGDFGGKLMATIAKMQFFPAIQQWGATSKVVLTIILVPVITLIFGRIYCSVICPLGTIQDIFIRRKRKFSYRKSNKLIRWAFPAAMLLLGAIGIQTLITAFEPFAFSGRIGNDLLLPAAAEIYKPVVAWMRNHDVYLHPLGTAFTVSACIFVVLQLAGLIALVIWRGRFYCNAICPVGAVLSAISNFSILGIRIKRDKCVSCGLCRNACKAECIDLENFKVEADRCLTCFSCLGKCPKNAISYGVRERPASARNSTAAPEPIVPTDPVSRRDFMIMTGAAACAIPLGVVANRAVFKACGNSDKAIAPPGAHSVARFNAKCTGCHLCIKACPEKVLHPAVTQYGLTGFMQPVLVYRAACCDYNCNICGQVCPNGAIEFLPLEIKQHTSIGIATLEPSTCVAHIEDRACGACDEVCPVKAVHMVANPKGPRHPTVPAMRQDICLGCGACEGVCPAGSIHIVGRPIHTPVRFEEPAEIKQEAAPPVTDGFAF